MNTKKVEYLVKEILLELGENPKREGLLKTPYRVSKTLMELTRGYNVSVKTVINEALFTEKVNNMIILKDIDIYSLCEHHLLPFFGKCHIGYIPKNKIIGISKLARIVDMYAKRLQVQERLTEEIAQTIKSTINPKGIGVVIEAQHLCMVMRGVEKQNSRMITSSMIACFRENKATREEFMSFIKSFKA